MPQQPAHFRPRAVTSIALLALGALTLAACTDNTAPKDSTDNAVDRVTVSSTAQECNVSATSAPSGNLTFSVTNDGSDVTEFYLLADDGLRIVSEVENIGPGLSRDLVVTVKPGSYFTSCKPGMVGDGIRAAFTVTDSGVDVTPTGEKAEQINTAVNNYNAYIKDQSESLLTATEEFVEAYQAGDDDTARTLYAPTRVHWERIEPVAESFGDLDPKMDLREADLEEGQEWTGWHRIEKDLWPPSAQENGGEDYTALTDDERTTYAQQLLADTQELYKRTHSDEFAETVDAAFIGNGAKTLLDEVATGKVTGEEEIWSHTDLWDFQANIDGARVAYDGLRDIVATSDPELTDSLDTRFLEIQELLDTHRDGEGFILYDQLSPEQVKALSNAVDALSEPLSHLTAAVVL